MAPNVESVRHWSVLDRDLKSSPVGSQIDDGSKWKEKISPIHHSFVGVVQSTTILARIEEAGSTSLLLPPHTPQSDRFQKVGRWLAGWLQCESETGRKRGTGSALHLSWAALLAWTAEDDH